MTYHREVLKQNSTIRYRVTEHGRRLIQLAKTNQSADLDILELLADNPEQTSEEIAKESGLDPKAVALALTRLIKSGRIIGVVEGRER